MNTQSNSSKKRSRSQVKNRRKLLIENKINKRERMNTQSNSSKKRSRSQVKNRRKLLIEDKINKRERLLTASLFGDCNINETEDLLTKEVLLTEDDVIDDIYNKKRRRPAWEDEEDKNIRVCDIMKNMTKARGSRGIRETSDASYEVNLREKYSQVMGNPNWAELDREVEETEGDELKRKAGKYLADKSLSGILPKSFLEYKPLKNLNSDSYAEGSFIKSIEFHPSLSIALVAGCTKNLGAVTLFQVGGKINHKIQSIKFAKFPIKCAKFIENGQKFVIGSNLYGNFYIYDIEESKKIAIPWNKRQDRSNVKKFKVSPDGKYVVVIGSNGKLLFYFSKSIALVDSMSVPCNVNDIAFDQDGTRLFTHGDNGRIYIICMKTRSCLHCFYDEGCIEGTSIAITPNGKLLACGSSSGIVNIYELSLVSSSISPKPLKSIGTLTTPVTSLSFNHSSEILSMASDAKDNAVKMVHLPSLTVFGNFPGNQAKMKKIQTVSFSPDSKYLALGNNAGAVHFFRLFHY